MDRENRTVRVKIIRNVVFSGLRAFVIWPVPFLLIPFILRHIGTVGYGTWAIFLAIISFTSLADLGLGGTLTKQVAEYYANSEFKRLETLLSTGIGLYLLIATLLVAALFLSSGYLLPILFRGRFASPAELNTLWQYLLMIVALNILGMPFYSVVTGLQRMDLSNFASGFNGVWSAVLAAVLLSAGHGLRGLLEAYACAALLTLVILAWMVHRLLPEVRPSPLGLDWIEMKQMLGFSLQLYVIQMATVIQNQIEKLYLAWFLGVVSVGWYTMASEAALRIRRVPEMLLSPMIAAASELDARGDQMRLRELYYRSHKYLAAVTVPITVYVIGIAHHFVELWVGPGLSVVAMPLEVLVIVNFLNLLTGPGFLLLVGKGELKPSLNATLLGILLIVVLSFIFINRFGFSGAVTGILLAVLVATVLFIRWSSPSTDYPFSRIIRRAYLKPVLCSVLALLLVLALARPSQLGWAGLLVHCGGFGAIYLAGLILVRFFDQFDLHQAEGFVPFARIARKIIAA
jgi:O-antigen/teichoic acid export membrane protein